MKYLLLLLLCVPVAMAGEEMPLLSVSTSGNETKGSMANLYLELEQGSGRVFIDTFPLTRMDTQISTRFAKEIACNFLDRNCKYIDFYYTLRSDAPLLGGPSAGASIAVLTVIDLENLDYNGDVAITGTINSGGVIGVVGGVREKVEVAAKNEISKVLIPSQTENATEIVEYGESLGIEVVRVSDLNQAIYEVSGEVYNKEYDELIVPEMYTTTMKEIATHMCGNVSERANASLSNGSYYSAASICFGENVEESTNNFKNVSDEEMESVASQISLDAEGFSATIELKQISTMTDLQAYMVVSGRIDNIRENLRSFYKANSSDEKAYYLAYAKERLDSAKMWSKFFGKGGKEIELNDELLKKGCIRKVNEAQERVEYLNFIYPVNLDSVSTNINSAFNYLNDGNYANCLFHASKAKAEVDTVISGGGDKYSVVKRTIAAQMEAGRFPLLGYSYYEYAETLRHDSVSSKLYLEYALELSNLDLYFGEKGLPYFVINSWIFYYFGLGALFGMLILGWIFKTLGRFRKESPPGKKR